MSLKLLDGKIAVVTGGSRGIGLAIARMIAKEGAKIALWATNEQRLNNAVVEAGREGGVVSGQVVQVQDAQSVQNAMDALLREHGKLDILVNNAGITRDGLLLRMKDNDWKDVLSVNLDGVFHCTRAALRPMVKQRSGRIVNITSVAGIAGNAGQANYSASKAGVIGFTKSVAREVASRGILVNAIAPGFIETDMTGVLQDEVRDGLFRQIPMGRFGNPDDVAEVALFLVASAHYITGQVIGVDGGLFM